MGKTNQAIVLAGLSKKANDYILKNSVFKKDDYIGCGKSDGTFNITANMSGTEYALDTPIIMFKYRLNNGVAKTKIQKTVGVYVFISLETAEGKEIKWSPKEIKEYINELSVNNTL